MMALGVLNAMVPRLWLYLRYWWNEVDFSSATITFDRLYMFDCIMSNSLEVFIAGKHLALQMITHIPAGCQILHLNDLLHPMFLGCKTRPIVPGAIMSCTIQDIQLVHQTTSCKNKTGKIIVQLWNSKDTDRRRWWVEEWCQKALLNPNKDQILIGQSVRQIRCQRWILKKLEYWLLINVLLKEWHDEHISYSFVEVFNTFKFNWGSN